MTRSYFFIASYKKRRTWQERTNREILPATSVQRRVTGSLSQAPFLGAQNQSVTCYRERRCSWGKYSRNGAERKKNRLRIYASQDRKGTSKAKTWGRRWQVEGSAKRFRSLAFGDPTRQRHCRVGFPCGSHHRSPHTQPLREPCTYDGRHLRKWWRSAGHRQSTRTRTAGWLV